MLSETRTVVNILNTFIKFHGYMNKDFSHGMLSWYLFSIPCCHLEKRKSSPSSMLVYVSLAVGQVRRTMCGKPYVVCTKSVGREET